MIDNTKKKPYLTNTEKKRYSMAAEHFIRGSSKFLENYHDQIRKSVDLDLMKDNFIKEYKNTIENYKKQLQEKAEAIAQQAENSLIKTFETLLLGSLAVYGVIKYFDIDVKGSVEKLKEYNETAKEYLKQGKNYFDRIDTFMGNPLGSFSKRIEDAAKELPFVITKGLHKMVNYVDNFLNGNTSQEYGNVFSQMLTSTAIFAFNRAFDSSLGFIFSIFFNKLHDDVMKRPSLVEFLKYGSEAFKEIREIEEITRELGKISNSEAVRMNASQYAELYDGSNSDSIESDISHYEYRGWIWNKKTEYKAVDSGDAKDEMRGFVSTMSDIHNSFIKANRDISERINLDNPFREMENPYSAPEYHAAMKNLTDKLEMEFDLDDRFFDGKLKDFYYVGESSLENPYGRYTEAYNKLNDFEEYYKNETNPTIRYMIHRWRDVKGRIESQRNRLKIIDANEITFLLISFNMYKKQAILQDYVLQDIETHNFVQESKIQRTLQVLKETRGRELDFTVDDLSSGIISLKDICNKFNNVIDNIETSGIVLKSLKRNDLFDGKISIYKIADAIKSIRNELLKYVMIQNGYKSENIYFFNNYSERSDSTYSLYTTGENASIDKIHLGENKEIKNGIALTELAVRLVQEFVNYKVYVKQLRERRRDLIIYLTNKFNELYTIYPKEAYENKTIK